MKNESSRVSGPPYFPLLSYKFNFAATDNHKIVLMDKLIEINQ